MDQDLKRKLELEYWATLAADPRYQDPISPQILHLDDAPSFENYLQERGFSEEE